jgi:excisionase family DNA binding protein
VGVPGQDELKTPRARNTAVTLADLKALWGGRDRLLRIAEVAEFLGVCPATVYGICDRGELPHVRINHAIRVRPRDLEEFVATRLASTQKLDPPRSGRRPEGERA